MTLQMFCIRDAKAEAYLRPFFAPTKGLALRWFIEGSSRPDDPMSKYPADYHLFHLGSYDDSDATFKFLPSKECLGCAVDFLNSRETGDNSGSTDIPEKPVRPVQEKRH